MESATATMVYRKTDIHHADAWIWNNLSNKHRCQRVLADSWRFTQAHLLVHVEGKYCSNYLQRMMKAQMLKVSAVMYA